MNEIQIGKDKITCPVDITEGLVLIDGDKRFTLKEKRGMNNKVFDAIDENDKVHPDIHDLGRCAVLQYTIDRVNNPRQHWMNI